MSLKGIHLLLITASTLLALGFALWCLQQYRMSPGTGLALSGFASLLSGLALAGYGVWFVKEKMRRLP